MSLFKGFAAGFGLDTIMTYTEKQSPESTISSKGIDKEPWHEINILTSVDLDEPLQPPFKLRNSKWCSVSSLPIIEYSSD